MTDFYDDSDMKIASAQPSKQIKESKRAAEAAENFDLHRDNGNLARAQRLGATFVCEIKALNPGADGSMFRISEAGEQYAMQSKLLVMFSFVVGMEAFIPDKLLVRTALNVFYDSLKKEEPVLYDKMSSSGAFSFYYLEYRRGGDPYRNVSKAFAMLCGKDGVDDYVKNGEEIFRHYYDFAKKLIAEVGFIQ